MSRKTVLISGGCGGVGGAVGKLLSEHGYDVFALYYNTPEEEVVSLMKTFAPGEHKAIRTDIRDMEATLKIVEEICESRGGIDVAVHTAVDPIIRKNMLELTEEEFKSQMGAAFFGGFNFLSAAGKRMQKANKGSIVGILSKYVEANVPHSRLAAYVTAKYALRGLLKELSLELAPYGVLVNALSPDFLDTKLNADLPEAVRAFVKDKMSVGSIRSTEDVARAVFHLAEESRATGQIYSFKESEIQPL
jgi:NAD(P)-dependent dehydrogenase (short-subunit alcohol dehydrogenase family)